MHQPMAAYSIKEQFSGRVVLLTGASGYIGGLVLECLLRTTDVAHIYVLLRSKGSSSTAQRLSQLLQVSQLLHNRHTHLCPAPFPLSSSLSEDE